ncbi:MAG TPA: ECF-type sigma factor [Steroidobacteraceae bacterium]|jgi:RNA polymerase sigma factor (TIGR02999 family)
MTETTLAMLMKSAETGDAAARQQLFATLYSELHHMAERQLKRNAAMTVSPTTLLHETFLSMLGRENAFADRAHFMAYASRAMRGLLIDYVRSRLAQKRGGEFHITSLPTEVPEAYTDDLQLEKMNGALEELSVEHPRLAQLVDLKFFCGFSFTEIGELLDISERTAKRDWEKARLLLHRFIKDAAP